VEQAVMWFMLRTKEENNTHHTHYTRICQNNLTEMVKAIVDVDQGLYDDKPFSYTHLMHKHCVRFRNACRTKGSCEIQNIAI
jgi:hypothetical protein